jgi:hypothetical protein
VTVELKRVVKPIVNVLLRPLGRCWHTGYELTRLSVNPATSNPGTMKYFEGYVVLVACKYCPAMESYYVAGDHGHVDTAQQRLTELMQQAAMQQAAMRQSSLFGGINQPIAGLGANQNNIAGMGAYTAEKQRALQQHFDKQLGMVAEYDYASMEIKLHNTPNTEIDTPRPQGVSPEED